MTAVSFGTAALYELAGDVTPARMLDEAWRVGFRRFDTAPSYGAGRSEQDVASLLRGRDGVQVVTTKAGLAPALRRPAASAAKGLVKRLLPSSAIERLRAARAPGRGARELHSGRFDVPVIAASVDASLRRLGRIDRLLLHEIRPLDVTPELLDLLVGLRERGDVGEIGVATGNADTADVLTAGGEVFTAVNYAVGVLHEPVTLPPHVTTRVGHGLLGAGGEHVRRVEARLAGDAALADRWTDATRGTEFAGRGSVARVLLARGPHLPVTELLTSTTRLTNVASAHLFATRTEELPLDLRAVLSEAVAAVRRT